MAIVKSWEVYDDNFRVVNHDDPSPLSAILMTDQEDPMKAVGYEEYALEYLRYDIGGKYGLSYDEWMAKPYCKRKVLLNALSDSMTRENAAMNQTITRLENEIKKLKGE